MDLDRIPQISGDRSKGTNSLIRGKSSLSSGEERRQAGMPGKQVGKAWTLQKKTGYGMATLCGNFLTATTAIFADPDNADLYLRSTAAGVIDKGLTLPSAAGDIDVESLYGSAFDIGADEWRPVTISPPTKLYIANSL
jgi:hypothetical protein